MAPVYAVTMLEQCRIYPPSHSFARESLPATFFDLVFWRFPPVQRLLFYNYPFSKSQFLDAELPNLKHSLKLSLKIFYPLAGRISNAIFDEQMPEIVCSENDYVELAVAVSSDDFYELSRSQPRQAKRFHPLVPPLLSFEDGFSAVFSVQITIYPGAGVSIGTSLHHAVGDGSTYAHFMKTWAAFNNCNAPPLLHTVPFYDRSKIKDPHALKKKFWKDLNELKQNESLSSWDLSHKSNVVRTTLAFSRKTLGLLGRRARGECSPYSLVCGYVWSCLVKARGGADAAKNKKEYFGFVTGCRDKLIPPLPNTYFGNCLGICLVEVERGVITGDDGPVAAAEAIWEVIAGVKEGVFKGAENWVKDVYNFASKKALTVAGSPKLGLYEVDFGFGRPCRLEIVSIERTSALSLAERPAETGGIEVGLALPLPEMEEFLFHFRKGLDELLNESV